MRTHHVRNFPVLPAAIFLAVFFISAWASVQSRPGLTLISSSPLERIYEWQAPEWEWQSVIIDGEACLRPGPSVATLWSRPGDPLLPMEALHFDLPPGQSAIVTLTDSLFSTEAAQLPLCPAPVIDPESGELIYSIDAANDRSGLVPEAICYYAIGTARDRRILAVSLHPVQYEPQKRSLRLLQYARLKIRFTTPERALLRPLLPPLQASAFTPLAKIALVDEGVYEVTGAALQAAGVPLSSLSPQNCQLYHRGVEQAIEVEDGGDGRFDPEDRLLFYGRPRRGDGEFYDACSDTNVYFLSSGSMPGLRFAAVAAGSSIATAADTFPDTLHFEQDLAYYAGDSDRDIHNSERAPGEGWVWSVLNKGGSAALAFTLPAPAAGQDSARLSLRLRGTTLDANGPDHHVVLSLNNTQIHEAWFNDREELIVRTSFKAALLRDGGNTLTVKLLADGPSERSQVYVDWFEITCLRTLAAQEDWLNFTPPAEGEKRVFIAGFADSSIRAWDLARQRACLPEGGSRQWRDRLSIQSGGYLDGNSARLFRGGKEAGYGYRGHNLWRIDPRDGRLVEGRNFDTYSSKAQADSMAAWIQRLPAGALIAAAIRDEGSVSMNEAAHAALESLGSALTRSVGARDSWALLGRKGAAPGSVPELLKKSQSGAAVIDTVLVFPEGASAFSTGMLLPADAGGEVVIFSGRGLKRPPRLSRCTEGDLISGGAGADYIIITHPLFITEARQLASYRAARNGWRTRVVTVEEIYDAFNYGLADPAAIRAFLRHARENWAGPAPAYLLLFGDASWDPKNNLKTARPTDFVPTYGNPVSDSWFGCLDGAGDILPDIHIGRLPVQTPEQARLILEKIAAYEAAPSAGWKKEFLFISGGFDFLEQNQFSQQSAQLIRQYVTAAPTFGHATALNKTSDGLEEGEHRQDILDTIDSGVAWANFIGHAGSRTWDLMFHNMDIEALNNAPRYPFITSMTCHTGRFAEPNQVAFGEHFLLSGDRGAIGFMGTSGWGYSYEDYTFLRKIFPAALQDTLRSLSEIIDAAKVQLWAEAGSSLQIRDMIYQYNLLGDPGLKLAVPTGPDLSLQPGDIEVIPEMPSEADSTARIRVRVHNWGLGTRDSVEVRLLVDHPNLGERVIASAIKLPPLGRLDSLEYIWPLRGLAGAIELFVQLDPMTKIKEIDENNNLVKRSVTILSRRISILSPTSCMMVPADKFLFKIQGMDLLEPKSRFIEIEIDTSSSFTSPLFQKSGPIGLDQIIQSWRPNSLLPDKIYYWRCKELTDIHSFELLSGHVMINSRTQWGWRQENFSISGLAQGLTFSNNVVLNTMSLEILAASAGANDGNFAGIYINGENVITPSRGHNIALLDPRTGMVLEKRKFDLYGNAEAVGDLIRYLDSIQSGYYVVVVLKDEGSFVSSDLVRAYESLGSVFCRNVKFRDSWALIGIKASPPGSAREILRRSGEGEAAVRDTLSYLAPLGTLTSPRIGPATAWRSLKAEAEVPQQCGLTLSLLGQRRGSALWDTLRTGLPVNFDNDISTISAQEYPWLQLVARFSTADQLSTPRLHAWQVLHDPAPDLAVSPAFLSLSADSVLAGQPVVLKLDIFNIGLARADSVRVSFSESAPGSDEKIFSCVTLPGSLAADQKLTFDQLYTPTGKPGSRLVTIRVDGDNRINELSESNNTLTTRVQVVPDTLQPQIDITFDGRVITSGDWVAAQPLIRARLIDDSPLSVADTLQINLLIDGLRVPFNGRNGVQLLAPPDTLAIALLQYRPLLHEGEHTLEILFTDASGNIGNARIDFSVAAGLQLLRVMNFPNPLSDHTDFTFLLTRPAEVRIRIYTVNGRLIRLLEAGALGAGFNRLFWDGRDGDGDLIANGVYLYRVEARDGSARTEVVEKCIIMR